MNGHTTAKLFTQKNSHTQNANSKNCFNYIISKSLKVKNKKTKRIQKITK